MDAKNDSKQNNLWQRLISRYQAQRFPHAILLSGLKVLILLITVLLPTPSLPSILIK